MEKARKNYFAALRLMATYRKEFSDFMPSYNYYVMEQRRQLKEKFMNCLNAAKVLRINAL